MTGYRKNKAANDEVFYHLNGDRYFKTGDMGRMVEGKFLKLTGRIKEQFKLENGKFVVPAPVEDVFCRSPYIEQMFIFGANQQHTLALIVPNYPNLITWYEKLNKPLQAAMPTTTQLSDPNTSTLDLFEEQAFKDLIEREVRQ